MAWFGQGRDTIEWEEFRDDVLFYKWPENEIKKGTKLIIRQGQKAIFFANGAVEGIFEEAGKYDITTQIIPFLSTLSGLAQLRSDSGMRAEVYFINSKQLLIPWGTRQRIVIPTPEIPSGIPVGCNGNLIIEFRDYLSFITNIAGIRSTYSISDISERIMGELGPIIAECILGTQQTVGLSVLTALQANSRSLGKKIAEELDKELFDMGLGVRDLNILSLNYPKEVQEMIEKVAARAFVGDVGKYTAVSMADSMEKGGGSAASSMAQMAMGIQMAQQMTKNFEKSSNQQENTQQADKFCTKCRKMVSSKFCPDCGTETV